MEKKYGVFEINTKSRYISEVLNQLEFLPNRLLHDTEEEAVEFIPCDDGHYVVLPIYIKKTSQQEVEIQISILRRMKEYLKKTEGTSELKNASLNRDGYPIRRITFLGKKNEDTE